MMVGMGPSAAPAAGYEAHLAAGRQLYAGTRIGRPGRARSYWLVIAVMRALRLRWRVDVEGAENVAPGAAVLVGNHVSALDPVVLVIGTWWRVTAFTKLEVFQGRGAAFFRLMGQIPLRRGDATATDWAIGMAGLALADGGMVGLYPEGTRSPDPTKLHRLHGRVLLPVLQGSPAVPVHAVTTRYTRRPRRRTLVQVRVSPPLPVDPRTMSGDEIVAVLRDTLLTLGGQTYVDRSARDAKADPGAA